MQRNRPSLSTDRLERVMAHKGLASRREAKALISNRLVFVNGNMITEPGYGVVAADIITVHNTTIRPKESVLVYKQKGVETTKTSPQSIDLHDRFPKFAHLSPIGRLDKNSEGLLLLSNDGTLTKALTKKGSLIGKIYLVTVREKVSDANLLKMSRGIILDGVPTKPATTTRMSRTSFTIILYEGRKHQIRRMCDACHLTVVSLVRTGIGHLTIDMLKGSPYRTLTKEDTERLKM